MERLVRILRAPEGQSIEQWQVAIAIFQMAAFSSRWRIFVPENEQLLCRSALGLPLPVPTAPCHRVPGQSQLMVPAEPFAM